LQHYWTIVFSVREYRSGNQKWTIQRNWQHRVHKTKKNTTQYVLDTTMCKQTQTTQIKHEPSYKQREVKTNRTSHLCGNHNGHHNTELKFASQCHQLHFPLNKVLTWVFVKLLQIFWKVLGIWHSYKMRHTIMLFTFFSSPCQRQCELLPSLDVRRLSSVNFSHFNFLLWNPSAKWTETW